MAHETEMGGHLPEGLANKDIQLEVPLSWDYVGKVRQLLEEALAQRAPSFRAAIGVVASELLENAIKYGEPVPAAAQAHFHLKLTDGKVEIEVRNGLRSGPGLQDFKERITRIAESENKEQLCLQRMQELISQPDQHGQLGLYRIVNEAGFELSCTYENEVLSVRAIRSIE